MYFHKIVTVPGKKKLMQNWIDGYRKCFKTQKYILEVSVMDKISLLYKEHGRLG